MSDYSSWELDVPLHNAPHCTAHTMDATGLEWRPRLWETTRISMTTPSRLTTQLVLSWENIVYVMQKRETRHAGIHSLLGNVVLKPNACPCVENSARYSSGHDIQTLACYVYYWRGSINRWHLGFCKICFLFWPNLRCLNDTPLRFQVKSSPIRIHF